MEPAQANALGDGEGDVATADMERVSGLPLYDVMDTRCSGAWRTVAQVLDPDHAELRRAVHSWEMARVERGHDVVCWRCLTYSGVVMQAYMGPYRVVVLAPAHRR